MRSDRARTALAGGAVGAAIYFIAPSAGPSRALVFTALTLMPIVACVAAIRLYRPRVRLPWIIVTTAYTCYALADPLWFTDGAIPAPADVLFLVSYGLLAIALATMARARHSVRARDDLLDTLVVSSAVLGVFWVLVIGPSLVRTGSTTAGIVSLAYPVVDIMLLAVVVRASFVTSRHPVSFALLASGVVCQLLADALYARALIDGDFHFGHPLMAGYIASFSFVSAAALHPSMVELTERVDPQEAKARPIWRLALLGACALVPPVILVEQSLRGVVDNVVPIAIVSALVFLLVLARTGQLLSDLRESAAIEERLREAEAKYRHLVERLPGVVYTAEPGPTGRWTYVSPQIEDMLGYAPEEWTSNPTMWLEMLHPEDRERVVAAEDVALMGDAEHTHDEYRLRARDGSVVWVRDEATLVCDAQRRPSQFRGVLLDITDRKVLEDELRQSQKMEAIGRLAGGVAHDFNNLLAVVQNYARFVVDDLERDDPRYEDVQEIIKAAERGSQLTRQLLTFSRREVVQPRVLDLNSVVSDIQRMLGRMMPANVQLITTLSPQLWRTRMDPGQLEQIIMNLAVNAKDAMPSGGKISLSTGNVEVPEGGEAVSGLAPGRYVCLTVEDTGSGMTEETMSRIFEPFFTTKPKGHGTGLGLATVYGIVEGVGGRIVPESQLGVGTTFRVYLPQADDDDLEVLTSPTDSRGAAPPNALVLVAEDEEPVRDVVARILRGHGYTVVTAANGMEAIRIAELHPRRIDLLLTDVVMPDVSGKEVSIRTGLATLFMSGYTDDMVAEEGVLGAGERLITKPFTPEELLRAVRSALIEKGPPREKDATVA